LVLQEKGVTIPQSLNQNFKRDTPKRSREMLSLEKFRVIADWYHFAILSLVNTKGFNSDPVWIGRRLGISSVLARTAIDRLLELGLLAKVGESLVPVKEASLETPHDISSLAVRQNHSQHLSLAQKALVNVPLDLREFGNLCLTMNSEKVPEAKRLIRKFLDKFNDEMESANGEEVFQINLQFYPLTRG
jgi:uncharacterized protein (TIGR02147 family)